MKSITSAIFALAIVLSITLAFGGGTSTSQAESLAPDSASQMLRI
jgi:hypothetical protein